MDQEAGTEQSGDNSGEDFLEKRLAFYLERLREGDVAQRWKAAESLARLGDERGIEPLVQALSDEDWRVRQKSAWALGYIGDPRALGPLRMAMRRESEGVREIMEEAVRAILARERGDEIPQPR
ncbi:MAG: HEAT repeat domain-containing protein [Methanoregulaceae archaeon]